MIQTDPSIARAAQRLRWIALGGIALLVATTALSVAMLLGGSTGAEGGAIQIDTAGLAPKVAAFVQLAEGGLLALAMWRLADMLGRVAAGEPFRTGAGLRGFAFYLFLAAIASILLPPIIQIASALLGAGARQATFSVGGDDLLMLFVTGTLFLVARLLDEAQRVADDASQIV